MKSFEEEESDPYMSFFVQSDDFPHLKYSFWVGPDSIDIARKFKLRFKDYNEPITRYDNNNQLPLDPWLEKKFSDDRHEDFYQWCFKKDSQEADRDFLQDLIRGYAGRYNIAADALSTAERDEKRRLADQRLMRDEEEIKKRLKSIGDSYDREIFRIDEEIARLQALKSKKGNLYKTETQRLEEGLTQIQREREESKKSDDSDSDDNNSSTDEANQQKKKPRSSGLYCAQCHHLRKGG
jgi:hypothetical protein